MNVYLIRHAQSIYNLGELEIHNKVGNDYLTSASYLAFKYDRQWVDCGITELGMQQCLAPKELMSKITLDIVIVSPLRRALATCHQIFKEHPSKPHIIVDPLFRQIMESSCDIGSRLEQSMKDYSYFDFKEISNLHGWYVDALDEKFRNWVYERVPEGQRNDTKKLEEVTLEMLKHFRKEGVVVDTEESMKARQLRQLDKLKKLYSGKRVAIVSHSEMIKHYVGIKIKNCEVREYTVA